MRLPYTVFVSGLVFLTAHSALAATVCTTPSLAPSFSALQDEKARKIKIFANSQVVAVRADALLSKLLAAKSPVFSNWLSKPEHAGLKEEDIVKAWRLYYARNFLLTKYPQSDAELNPPIEALVDSLLATYLDAPTKLRFENRFHSTRAAAVDYLRSLKLEATVQSQLVDRVQALKLYWPTTLKSASNNSIPLDLIDWGIAYDPQPNQINIGLNALAYPNNESIAAVFAHEIGHAFDSCRWGAFFKGPWPFEKVGKCLRLPESVGAKRRDDRELVKMSADIRMGLEQNPTCNRLVYPPAGLQADQLPESFADWFSAEIMARLPSIDSQKIRTDLCDDKPLASGSSYVSNTDRLNRIYGVQPQLAGPNKTGAKGNPRYCAW